MTEDTKKRIQIKIDRDLDSNVNAVFEELGLNPSVVVTALYRRVAAEGRIPFDFKLTDDEKARIDLARSAYNSNVPVLSDPQKIEKYLAEDDEDED
ncbi:type II toxin-antitoxin system RelB/DinJ family antitoxin [Lentilactobacillus kisonensis]|uniref:Addiction module antitoxin, RelB DinJ family n=1 Tax=Lentilactobacillus kisonensis DSM 19906 = JCM 15041 TaxID=1423766 RepID=A0A0R1P1D8_9LACO|nr:type II toxin-antitoxin system RelB/DinJ family antitoxin [Lentilactobacillus kisonensis]KRL22899.1 addiction module antitoxin, RelB DinJ family [Lentilactobacillus kisonensis DSM 19906 = JCM 15041]